MKRISIILALLLLTIMMGIPAWGMHTGFATETLPKKEAETFLSEVDIQSLSEPPSKGDIISFNVCDEWIALAIETSQGYNRKFLCFYNLDGRFVKGYTFLTRDFGVDWDGDNILIYFDHKDIAISLDISGQVSEICGIPYTGENLDYWNQHVYAATRRVNGVEYRLENNPEWLSGFKAVSYSRLVAEDAQGNCRTLYDVKQEHNRDIIVRLSILLLLLVVGVVYFTVVFRKRQNRTP